MPIKARVVAVVPACTKSRVGRGTDVFWEEVMAHEAVRLKWTDPTLSMLVFTDGMVKVLPILQNRLCAVEGMSVLLHAAPFGTVRRVHFGSYGSAITWKHPCTASLEIGKFSYVLCQPPSLDCSAAQQRALYLKKSNQQNDGGGTLFHEELMACHCTDWLINAHLSGQHMEL